MVLDNEIISQALNGNSFVAVIIIAIHVIKNPKGFVLIFDTFKFSKISILNLALKSKYLKGSSRTLIEDQLEQRYVYLSTGLNAEKLIRQKILEVYAHSEGRVNFRHFVRVNNRFNLKNPTLSIKWGRYEFFSLWALGIASIGSLIFMLILILLMLPSIVYVNIPFDQAKEFVLIISMLSTTSLFYFYCWGILISTNIVRKEIESFNKIDIASTSIDPQTDITSRF